MAAPASLFLRGSNEAGLAGFAGEIWRAPLVPIALAVTTGIVLDRCFSVQLALTFLGMGVALFGWIVAHSLGREPPALAFLLLGCMASGAAWHHYRRDVYPADDIGNFAPAIPHPVQLRGVVEEEPQRTPARPATALTTMDKPETIGTVLRVAQVRQRDDWIAVSGRVRLIIAGPIAPLHVGDAVEVAGRLSTVQELANPGEASRAGSPRDQGMRALVTVRKTPDGVTRLERGWPTSFTGCLMAARSWGQQVLGESLPAETSGVAMALVLGEGAPMTTDDWDKYQRSGVIHVLAISGQHLVILAMFCWWVLRLFGVRQRRGAVIVAVLLLLYALLTGGRPPALRCAVTVCAVATGFLLRRRVLPANSFALSWLIVAILNPADLFTAGCQLSFLSVAILYWGTRSWFHDEPDALDRLIDETRPLWWRGLRWVGRLIYESYAISLFMWLVLTPLVASHYHLVSPIGVLLGPPLVLLGAVALLAGFLLLMSAIVWQPLTFVFAPIVHHSLWLCDWLVDTTLAWPGSYLHVADVPAWWLWLFYLALLAVLTQDRLRRYWRWAVVSGVGWLCIGIVIAGVRLPSDELRCTFLAVGHGGCTVLETPDGRVLLYDAGAIAGPDVTRRHIAPYLWSRGIRRIDEVFLSHADLDHFNGLPELLDRFAVGQVSLTPTFADKTTPGVEQTLQLLQARAIPIRILKAGDCLTAGDVHIDVLHPPAAGPEGNENARSMVLEVRHADHRILLTGDLEGAGLEQVLQMPPRSIDVLMAPHHGSRASNKSALADWARPRVVVSCQGQPRGLPVLDTVYGSNGTQVFRTWPHGAVTVRSHASGLIVETYTTGERVVLRTNREK